MKISVWRVIFMSFGKRILPESVKFKLPSKAERLINTAFSPKVLMFEFAPNGCRKTYIKNA